MTFRETAAAEALRWKAATSFLPDAARAPASFFGRTGDPARDLCIPHEFAALNLLPAARDAGLEFFDRYQLMWQGGARLQPSNHLLSSQVQCVNVLAPLMRDGDAIAGLFRPWLPIKEVLEFGSGHDEVLVFEWTGLHNYLGEFGTEGPAGHQRKATSADAAFRYLSHDDEIETVLVEWKYVEAYRDPAKHAVTTQRLARYRGAAEAHLVLSGVIYEDLFVEPFYQLMRLQLLAAGIETAGEGQCNRARLLHVAPAANLELQRGLSRASLRNAGESIYEVWNSLLRRPNRFIPIDSGNLWRRARSLMDPAVHERYAHLSNGSNPEDLEEEH